MCSILGKSKDFFVEIDSTAKEGCFLELRH
jgi:hypothetical protein